MSATATALPARARRADSLRARSLRTGLIVGLFSFVLFTAAAWRLAAGGYVLPFNAAYWGAGFNPLTIGGQWLAVALLTAIRLVPGSTPAAASIVTVVSAAILQAWLARTLVRRGWPPAMAALGMGLTALHPVTLYMATSGSTLLLVVLAAGAVINALDRVEAIGDAQALIVLGIAIAGLFVVWSNALYLTLAVLVALPLASREVRSASAALATFFIAAIPSMVLIGAFTLGASLFGLSISAVWSVWRSPLHGAPPNLVAASFWLRIFGGQLVPPLLTLLLLCFTLSPCLFSVLERLLLQRAERRRPVTALVALAGPSLAGALMTYNWHLATVFTVVALSMAGSAVWTVTAQLRPRERWFWMAASVIGVTLGWSTPLLWRDADAVAWREILMGGPLLPIP